MFFDTALTAADNVTTSVEGVHALLQSPLSKMHIVVILLSL